LCTPLDTGLLIFLVFTIIFSFIIGYTQRKKFQINIKSENPHKNKNTTLLFIIIFILFFINSKEIPIVSILGGKSISDISMKGIPHFNIIIASSSIVYSFYLSYLFVVYKKKDLLYENIIIILFHILLVARQNILIIILGFIYFFYSSKKEEIKNSLIQRKKRTKRIVLLFLISAFILYIFGIIGNFRYGSKFKWNETYMIENLGKINDNWPSFLSKQYFWSYIYVVSPLANLNANVIMYKNSSTDYRKYFSEFIPEFINEKINGKKDAVYLPVKSLNVCTTYVRAYNYFGYLGLYVMFFVYMFIITLITNLCYKHNTTLFPTIVMSLTYVLWFTFFDNTIVYSISSLIIIISFLLCFKYKNFT